MGDNGKDKIPIQMPHPLEMADRMAAVHLRIDAAMKEDKPVSGRLLLEGLSLLLLHTAAGLATRNQPPQRRSGLIIPRGAVVS